MDNAFQQFGFVMVIRFAMKVLTLIATVLQTNLNVQMDNAFQKVGYVMIAMMEVMKLIATSMSVCMEQVDVLNYATTPLEVTFALVTLDTHLE